MTVNVLAQNYCARQMGRSDVRYGTSEKDGMWPFYHRVLPTVHLFYLVTLNFVLNSYDISTVGTYVWRDFDNTDGIRLNAWICLGNVGHVLFKVILKLAYIAIYKSYCINFVDFDNSF